MHLLSYSLRHFSGTHIFRILAICNVNSVKFSTLNDDDDDDDVVICSFVSHTQCLVIPFDSLPHMKFCM